MLHDFRKGRSVRIFGRKNHRYYVYSGNWSISDDARYAAFITESKLIRTDRNHEPDIYWRNLRTGKTVQVTKSALGGVDANMLSMSADGNLIVYASKSANLVKGDTNQAKDIFLYDRAARTTSRVSVGLNGEQGLSGSTAPAISADGRYLAFLSEAGNLVADDSHRGQDVFLRDLTTGENRRISRHNEVDCANCIGVYFKGMTPPVISRDGRYVAFGMVFSDAIGNNNAGISIYDRDTDTETITGFYSDYAVYALAPDGNTLAFVSSASGLVTGDTHGGSDIYIYRIDTKTLNSIDITSIGITGYQGSGFLSLSADGTLVAFSSHFAPSSQNIFQAAFVHDLRTGTTTRIAQH